MTGDYPGAAHNLQEALGISRDLSHPRGQLNALIHLGESRRLTGDYPGAARDLQQVAEICSERGERVIRASALNYLGVGACSPAIPQERPGTCRRRWASSDAWATGRSWPRHSPASQRCGGLPATIRARPRTCRRHWTSPVRSAARTLKVTAHNESGTLIPPAVTSATLVRTDQQALDLARQVRIVPGRGARAAGLAPPPGPPA